MASIREQLSDYAHATWSGWMQYMFSVCTVQRMTKQEVILSFPAKTYARWVRQLKTSYEDLPESEKASDRKEADRILQIVTKQRCMF